jgi:uncharacterized protein YdbL (DUF1318 family)
MTRNRLLYTLLSPLCLLACVTINVYFPAAAAEKAADRILDEVYGKLPAGTPAPKPATPDKGSDAGRPTPLSHVGMQILDWLVSPAHAEADISIDSPAIRAITASLSSRKPRLQAFYASGAIGMGADGTLAVHDLNAVPLKDRNTLKQLMADDNKDWNALYREVAAANGHPEWEGEIRATFVRRWVANDATAGWWYQGSGGKWQQK